MYIKADRKKIEYVGRFRTQWEKLRKEDIVRLQ
jgi:hypothetical protein